MRAQVLSMGGTQQGWTSPCPQVHSSGWCSLLAVLCPSSCSPRLASIGLSRRWGNCSSPPRTLTLSAGLGLVSLLPLCCHIRGNAHVGGVGPGFPLTSRRPVEPCAPSLSMEAALLTTLSSPTGTPMGTWLPRCCRREQPMTAVLTGSPWAACSLSS
jgi:hypothetical protein